MASLMAASRAVSWSSKTVAPAGTAAAMSARANDKRTTGCAAIAAIRSVNRRAPVKIARIVPAWIAGGLPGSSWRGLSRPSTPLSLHGILNVDARNGHGDDALPIVQVGVYMPTACLPAGRVIGSRDAIVTARYRIGPIPSSRLSSTAPLLLSCAATCDPFLRADQRFRRCRVSRCRNSPVRGVRCSRHPRVCTATGGHTRRINDCRNCTCRAAAGHQGVGPTDVRLR